MALLNRTQLLEKQKIEVKKVELGKDSHVFVRSMYAGERDAFESSLLKEVRGKDGIDYERNQKDFRAKLAVYCVCDKKGKRIFRPSDFALLSENMSAERMERIVNVAQALNRISEDDREALVKNSEGVRSANSTSGSQDN